MKDMLACDNVEQLIEILRKKRIIIYGAGYTASVFLKTLKRHGLEKNIFCVAVSDIVKNADRRFAEFEVKQIDEIDFLEDMVVCIAVHESFVREIEALLQRNSVSNYVWIYPFLFDLYYGNPVKSGEWISLNDLILKDEGRYALAIRWAAVADYYGKCQNGFMWYKRAITYLHNASVAEVRTKVFKQLIKNWQMHGYDGIHEIAINDDFEVLDGEHRVTVALYHGERMIKCRIYKGKNLNTETSLMKKSMLIESGFDEEEIKILDSIHDSIRNLF